MLIPQNLNETDTSSPSKLSKKWQQIEKRQTRNANMVKKINALYEVFKDDVLPYEKMFINAIIEQTVHLMTFLKRKSFTQWEREELYSWIDENIEEVSQHPFGDVAKANELHQQFTQLLTDSVTPLGNEDECSDEDIASMRQLLNELLGDNVEFTDEELSEFLRDPEAFKAYMEQHIVGEHDHSEEDEAEQYTEFDDDDNDDFFQQNNAQQKRQNRLKDLFDSSNLNKMYKIIANRIHPDKEHNADLKVAKSELMAKLVKAKQDKDAFVIISMFHQFVPDAEMSFFDGTDQELTDALVQLLNQKLADLDTEHRDNKYHNGLTSMVWQKFSARSKKATQEGIEAHLMVLNEDIEKCQHTLQQVKTVKALKEDLKLRYEYKTFNPFANGPISLNDLFSNF